MKNPLKAFRWLAILSAALVLARPGVSLAAEPSAKPARPKLYDTTADGNQQIASALKTAKTENKRIILKFGAEW